MAKRCVVKMKFGSHLYGTDTPSSDLDFKSVYIPDAEAILLQRVKASIKHAPEKAFGEKNAAGDVDDDNYSLQRYLSLLIEGQTVALDMLFAPDRVLIETSPVWEMLRANTPRLLTKKSLAFVGYCRQQANKYGIKGSRVSAAKLIADLFEKALTEKGTQAKVGECETDIRAIQNEHVAVVEYPMDSTGKLGLYIECCNRKIAFTNTVKHAHEVYSKIYEAYGARAKLAQTNEGVDWKALSHAVRVGHEALELLITGKITLPLKNAEYVLAIKQGRQRYDDVAKEIEHLLIRIEEESITSSLPAEADRDFVDSIVRNAYLERILEMVNEKAKIIC